MQAPWEITGADARHIQESSRTSINDCCWTRYAFPLPCVREALSRHDFKEMTWRHLNFFQHHCYITASVPRVRCPEHKVKQVIAPWARKESNFTLLFEQSATAHLRSSTRTRGVSSPLTSLFGWSIPADAGSAWMVGEPGGTMFLWNDCGD